MKKKLSVVSVPLKERRYEVVIGENLFGMKLKSLKPQKSKKAVLVSDERLEKQREVVKAQLSLLGWDVYEISVLAGEGLKDFEKMNFFYAELLKARADRHTTLFALGGGSIGDAAGFVASTYMRGIRWVGLPTTLLAQVDSSIGGKTAVNHALAKNLIGTFHQPSAVYCDLQFLRTLSKREMVSGLGEVIKYGLIYEPKLFSYIQKNWHAALQFNTTVLQHLVKSSVQIKAKKVGADEFDRKGLREALNFGHTFAHALESVTDYKVFQHGEAVIWGQRFALAVSALQGHLKKKDWQICDEFLARIEVPQLPTHAGFENYYSAMMKDKKIVDGKVRFVLLKKMGRVVLDKNVEKTTLLKAYEWLVKGEANYGG